MEAVLVRPGEDERIDVVSGKIDFANDIEGVATESRREVATSVIAGVQIGVSRGSNTATASAWRDGVVLDGRDGEGFWHRGHNVSRSESVSSTCKTMKLEVSGADSKAVDTQHDQHQADVDSRNEWTHTELPGPVGVQYNGGEVVEVNNSPVAGPPNPNSASEMVQRV